MGSKKIENLISKYLTNEVTSSELNYLSKWIEDPENERLFYSHVKTFYEVTTAMNVPNTDDIKKNLLEKIKRDKNPFYNDKVRRVMKYAAVLVIFLSIGYLYHAGYFDNKSKLIIPNESITLQLENGNTKVLNEDGSTKLVDAKGRLIGEQNGNQLVYTNDEVKETIVYNTLNVPYGKRFTLQLSDGTLVYLNSGTSLKYPVNFITGKSRKVFLKGEAYFDVTKDENHPFIVNADGMDVRVLGTQFNIASYPEDNEINTVLVEGAVSIYKTEASYNTEDVTILKPGFKAAWQKNSNQIHIGEVDIELHTAWINGRIIFRHMPFNNIMKKLERHYNVTIINNNINLGNDLLSASFDVETIEQVFETINEIHPIDFVIKDNKIIIN
ncbi:FecR domain-containing protein [Flavivirga aquimarina]|uniref:FecR domain-containing protein n=1 Tax=Flavivirga aquimarina TaxID=2027862 RepID=A0ABT8W6L2_9FLAO|nr:FecR family protein [Flavivirga aquimarina]MDO5968751.1 FecR domain-containing protein [Flavivirga aquimarina]